MYFFISLIFFENKKVQERKITVLDKSWGELLRSRAHPLQEGGRRENISVTQAWKINST